MTKDTAHPPVSLPNEFLAKLTAELDDDAVTAIILHGSYARGNARPPYSDVDLVRILRETSNQKQQKQFLWYDGYLLNLSSRPLSVYQKWLTMPQEAIFRVSTIREAHILLEKDGAFRTFQQETLNNWKWEPLQSAANAYASQLLVELSEAILRTLGALQYQMTVMLIEQIFLNILPMITEAVGVQRGILATGNNYVCQIQETVGLGSAWTNYYMSTVGETNGTTSPLSMAKKAAAVLHLYQETVQLLRPFLFPEHEEAIEPLLKMINDMLH